MNPLNPSFAEEVERSFARQPIMNLIGARLSLVEPGVVEITLPYRADLAQHHGYLHTGDEVSTESGSDRVSSSHLGPC